MTLPGWHDLETARSIKSFFELWAILLFAAVVLFEVLAHRSPKDAKKKHVFDVLALGSFGLAVAFELCAYPYSKRVDTLAEQKIQSALAAAKMKPFNERLIDCLNWI